MRWERATPHCLKCGHAYPIEGNVPSFEGLFRGDLLEEAANWSRWYSFWWDRGHLGFCDLNDHRAPLITQGIEVLDPGSVQRDTSSHARRLTRNSPA
jgi:hypothetical protein